VTDPEENIFQRSDQPLSVGLLILPDSNLLSLAACIDPMRAANRRADRDLFHWQLLSIEGGKVPLTSGFDIETAPLGLRPEVEVLIVLAGFSLTQNTTRDLLRRLRDVAPRMRAVGGVDGGSWVLGRAGVLDGHMATTHWEDFEEFADVFPAVEVVRDRYTISGRVFTTGGAAPALDLMLHLIRTRYGTKLADEVAGTFLYETARVAEVPQIPFSTARLERTAPKVAAAIVAMNGALEDPPPADVIARQVGLTRRGLEMAFHKALGTSPGTFFLGQRLAEARRLALDTGLTAQEIGLRTGFNSQAVFARAFKREFGLSVTALRRLHRA